MHRQDIGFLLPLIVVLQTIYLNLLAVEAQRVNETNSCKNLPAPVVLSSNNLGFAIAKSISHNSNTFFSPLSLSMAFGMAYRGAGNNTAHQMETALSYRSSNISGYQVHAGIKQLCEDIHQQAENFEYDLTIANALFYDNGTLMADEFITDINSYYHADAFGVNFGIQPEESTALINDWVKTKTSNKIDKLYEDSLSSDTQAVLTNAIYFKGTWKIEFPEGRSYDGYFFDNTNPSVGKITRMMSLADETFPFLKDETTGYKFMELPYKGGKTSMLFALPLKYDQIPDLELTSDLFCRIRMEMVETELENVVIPKFKFAYEKKLKETMMSLGMIDAFAPGVADFSRMISEGAGLYISEVLHKAVIEVNEKGSEAAAVSGIQIMPVSFREITEFVANHPFQFYIIDKTSGTILFSGTVIDPSVSAR